MATLLSTTNGGAVADATSNFDAMDKLLNFLTGVTGSLPAIQQWTVLKDVTITSPVPGVTAGDREVYLRGPGLSGTDNIYVNIRLLDDVAANSYNWIIYGATGFDTNEPINNQPGVSTGFSVLTLDNLPAGMPFWFIANGRRFICVFKVALSTVACHGGWYLPYATPSEFPYPIFTGGNSYFETARPDIVNYTIGNFYDGPYSSPNAVGMTRHRDGTWLTTGNFAASTSGARPTTANAQSFVNPFNFNMYDISFPDFGIIESDGPVYPVFPSILYSDENGGNIYGEIDGVFFTPSRFLNGEDTITIGGDTYLILNNTYRTAESNCAILLE